MDVEVDSSVDADLVSLRLAERETLLTANKALMHKIFVVYCTHQTHEEAGRESRGASEPLYLTERSDSDLLHLSLCRRPEP